MKLDKTNFTVALPTPLYNRLASDSSKFGIPKSNIVVNLLVEYYRKCDALSEKKSDDI